VAVQKICGIETEYGIVHRGIAESNPVSASSLLINAYVSELAVTAASASPPVGWDFEDETPGRDARGAAPVDAAPPEVETHLVNAVLTNGARFYVDHAHPEISSPECADARSVVVFDRAAELIMARAMEAAARALPPGQEIVVHKNNSDGKGNSYGCHENYLMDRAVPFGRIVTAATTHFVTRQVFTGAGKVGAEASGAAISADVAYQLSQRADFFEAEVGLETTLKRPIVNTRDEPHADAQRYRRLHVIAGDANLSEVATLLKVGTTAILLAMVEDEALDRSLSIRAPVAAIRTVSHDPTLAATIETTEGVTMTALDVQFELLDRAKKWAEDRGLEAVGPEVGAEVLRRWEEVLTGLEADPESVAAQVDWVAKRRLIDGWTARHGTSWSDPRAAALALQYHDLRPGRCLARRAGLETLTSTEEVARAVTEPPTDTRAYFRGRCLAKFSSSIVAANWDSLVFDIGSEPLRRVPMMEPSRGTEAHVGRLLDECSTPAELVARLSS